MKKVVLLFAVLTVLLPVTLLLAGKFFLNDRSVATTELAEPGDRVLAVFSHPDDEIMVSGTLARLDSNDIPTGLVYLTRGEAGPTGGLVPQSQLGPTRFKEAHAVKDILGVDYMRVFDFPDSGISEVPAQNIKLALLRAIEEFRPTIVIGFDETIGLYGHEDHRLAGLYLHQLLKEKKPKFVQSYYMVTLSKPLIRLALKMSSMFSERYAKDPSKGLPQADVAVKIWAFAPLKKRVLGAHKTQWEVIDDVQPYGMVTPSFLYYGIFDREYYAHVVL
jgi:LmbE family N-acetylglucosaminyl deacetylase